jgi:hypothetical protein
MPKRQEPKKEKHVRTDLGKEEMKEAMRRKELAKRSKLPKGLFENTGSSDPRYKSSRQMTSGMQRKLDWYEDKKSTKKSK